MSKYEDLAYLYTSEHRKACCEFANFLADKLAEYLGCDRGQIGFTKTDSNTRSLVSRECSEAIIKDVAESFIVTTIAVILPEERMQGSHAFADLRILKFYDEFQVAIGQGWHQVWNLSRNQEVILERFFDTLYKSAFLGLPL